MLKDGKQCLCLESNCGKCLSSNCQDKGCAIHTLEMKEAWHRRREVGNKNEENMTSGEKSFERAPVIAIGGGGERNYLRYGAIYAFDDRPDKEFHIVVRQAFHLPYERLDHMTFFDTPEEAVAAGYKPSKYFAKDYRRIHPRWRWFGWFRKKK